MSVLARPDFLILTSKTIEPFFKKRRPPQKKKHKFNPFYISQDVTLLLFLYRYLLSYEYFKPSQGTQRGGSVLESYNRASIVTVRDSMEEGKIAHYREARTVMSISDEPNKI